MVHVRTSRRLGMRVILALLVVSGVISSGSPARADDPIVPSAPQSPSAIAGNVTIAVTWSSPASDGGSAVTGYTATAEDSSSNTFYCTTDETGTGCTIEGLTNGVEYSVTIVATNENGNGTPTSPIAVTPNVVPGAPTLVSAIAGNATIAVTWSAGSNSGTAITGYTATATDAEENTATCSTGGSATTCTISSGLTNGTEYTVTVVATNAKGSSANSDSLPATPKTVPSYPTLESLTPGDGSIAVTWSGPSSLGGGTLDGYRATATDSEENSFTCSTDETETGCTITGLTNGTQYSVVVQAHNEIGYSTASGSGSSTPRTVPEQVDAPTVTSLNASLKVEWSAPANGGSTITSYTATADDGTTTHTCTWTTGPLQCTISGLTNGTSYDVTVVATNAAGSSTASDPTSEVPATVPTQPSITTVTRVLGTISVYWSAPSSSGGAAIVSYTVTGVANDASSDVTCTWNDGDGALTCDLVDVVDTAGYSLSVVATNSAGNSSASSASSSSGFAAPGAPTLTSVTPGNTTLTVAFTAGTTGGLTITDYLYSLDGGATFDPFPNVAGPYVITGLTNGHTYSVKVAAVNDLDQGTASNAISATPATVPSAPRWLHGVRGNATAILAWNPPAANGGAAVTSYLVSDLAGHTCTATAPATTCTVTGLTNGVSYTFYATATNSAGTSSRSNGNIVVPATSPSAPTIVSVTPGNRLLEVRWTAPSSTGGAALGYYDISTDGGVSWVSTYSMVKNSVITIRGLTNGTAYAVKLRARNVVGPGAASESVAGTPRTIPGAPRIIGLTAATQGFTVTFAAPSSTGGSPITTYQYSLNNGVTWTTRATGTTSLSFAVTGLVAHRKYNVMIRAVNVAGSSLPSVWRSVTTL